MCLLSSLYRNKRFLSRGAGAARSCAQRAPRAAAARAAPYCLTRHRSPEGLGARPVGAGAERRGATQNGEGAESAERSCAKLGFGEICAAFGANFAKLDTIWRQLREAGRSAPPFPEEAALDYQNNSLTVLANCPQ